MNRRGLTLIELIVILAIIAILSAIAIPKMLEKPSDRAEKAKAWAEYVEQCHQNDANKAVNNLVYIKDPRTDICFAYCWNGAANGGPALTVVPCEMVPAELLHIATIDK